MIADPSACGHAGFGVYTAAMSYPFTRMRRNRSDDFSRRLVRATTLTVDDLIYPMFVIEGQGRRQPVESMPGIERLSVDQLVEDAKRCVDLGVPAVALFPNVEDDLRTPDDGEAVNPEGLVPKSVAAVKAACPELGVITDAAVDPYTSHGHDGLLDERDYVVNDLTVETLAEQSLVCARAGADVIAPSDMMDGRVGAIRRVRRPRPGLQARHRLQPADAAEVRHPRHPDPDAVPQRRSGSHQGRRAVQVPTRSVSRQQHLRPTALVSGHGSDVNPWPSFICKRALAGRRRRGQVDR